MKTKNLIVSFLILLLVSSTGIMLEISLSRLFSYMLSYHFVFIIIAFTLFGLGIGEIAYYRWSWVRSKARIFYDVLPFSILFSFILLVSLNKSGIFATPSFNLIINILMAVLPFIAIGVVKADIFHTQRTKAAWLYSMDLAGSAGGALLTVFILNNLGLPKAFLISYVLLAIAGLLSWVSLSGKKNQPYLRGVIWVVLVAFLGWASFWAYNFNPSISKDNDKDMLRLMSNPAIKSRIIETEWNSFGKTDLVELTNPDGSSEKVMFVDGAAGTTLVSIEEIENNKGEHAHQFAHFPATFGLNLLKEKEKDSVLIIGPGGGVDMAATWLLNFSQIDAVEINPSFVSLMEKYNPSTFTQKDNIAVYVQEGRNFVRETKNRYDVVMLTIPVTKGGRGADFYGLSENYLFTREAVKDYLNVLTPEGRLIFTMHNATEVYKMLSNYLELMETKGIDGATAMKNVFIYSSGMMPLLIIRKTPFEKNETEINHILAHQYNLDRETFFIPNIQQLEADTLVENINYQWYMFDRLIYGISQNKFDYKQLSEAAVLNLEPVNDDSPYFFNYENGIPNSLMTLFILSLIVMGWLIFMTARGWKFRQELIPETRKKLNFLAFVVFVLGICYFFVQSYLFQVLNLQLSNPAQSFSLLLFTFLLGNGLGSFYTGLFQKNFLLKAGLYSLVVAIVMVAVRAFVVPGFAVDGISQPLMVVLLLIPAFFIGIPFPSILKEVSGEQEHLLPLFLGISSLVSMSTAVMVIVISMLWGYSYVVWLGVIGYIIVALSLVLFYRKNLKVSKNA
jgi:spermidine synthase